MFKLTRFRATNIIGFNSGLQRKTFDIDLSELYDKDTIVILGDNATGKSTFISLIHPMHTPSNKKKRFVVPGKEGSVIREYTSTSGLVIITKCLYIPSGDKHNSKLYFTVVSPNGHEEELNPNGNVASYYDLVKAYFGINQDFINFASYNNTVKGIVAMTDSERKTNVAPLMPNTTRFEIAHNIINEKYKEYRLFIRNISQKLTRMHDESTLKSELKRAEMYINEQTILREDVIKDISKYEEKLSNATSSYDFTDMHNEYVHVKTELSNLIAITKKPKLDMTASDASGVLNELNVTIANLKNKKDEHIAQLDSIGDDIKNITEMLMQHEGLEKVDTEPILRAKKEYENILSKLNFSKSDLSNLEKLNQDEAVRLLEGLQEFDSMCLSVYETHGQYVSEYFKKNVDISDENERNVKTRNLLNDKILEISNDLNSINFMISNMEDVIKSAEAVLNNKPAECEITNCAFIRDAYLKIEKKSEIDKLAKKRDKLSYAFTSTKKELDHNMHYGLALSDIQQLITYASTFNGILKKYINCDINEIYETIGKNGSMDTYIDKCHKQLVAITERDIYLRSTSELANINLKLQHAEFMNDDIRFGIISREKKRLEKLVNDERRISEALSIISKELITLNDRRDSILSAYEDILEYDSNVAAINALKSTAEELSSKLESAAVFNKEIKRLNKELEKHDEKISTMLITRDKYKYELSSILELKMEKEMVDLNFNIVHIMKSIVQPGKGIWKEILDMYMYDIKDIANQLLVHTFNGELYLEDFIIEDNSFIIPYVYRGVIGADVSLASDSQQSTICTAMSLAILSKMVDKYGIMTYDEVDKDLSPSKKEEFVDIMTKRSKYIGISQNFIITHNPEYYEPHEVGYVLFPGYKLNKKHKDYIEV